MDELEEIKKRKLYELMQRQQEQQQNQIDEKIQLQQQIQQLESIIKPKLTKKAAERYSNLKIAHHEKAIQVLVLLAQAVQAGQISKVDDEQLKELLKRLTIQKKEFKIRRK